MYKLAHKRVTYACIYIYNIIIIYIKFAIHACTNKGFESNHVVLSVSIQTIKRCAYLSRYIISSRVKSQSKIRSGHDLPKGGLAL